MFSDVKWRRQLLKLTKVKKVTKSKKVTKYL